MRKKNRNVIFSWRWAFTLLHFFSSLFWKAIDTVESRHSTNDKTRISDCPKNTCCYSNILCRLPRIFFSLNSFLFYIGWLFKTFKLFPLLHRTATIKSATYITRYCFVAFFFSSSSVIKTALMRYIFKPFTWLV